MRNVPVYYAPMEGITTAGFRGVIHGMYPEPDAYYAPFIQPNLKKVLTAKEKKELLPEYNQGFMLVPQVLTDAPEEFVRACHALFSYGYKEVNLNLGCPSGTVVSKGKGAGMLRDPEALDRFLDGAFSKVEGGDVSLKVRLGLTEEDDPMEYVRIYGKYPVKKLMIHPRFRSDLYEGKPRLEWYLRMAEYLRQFDTELCFNGDMTTAEEIDQLLDEHGELIDSIMIGRGLLTNPALVRTWRGGEELRLEELRDLEGKMREMYLAKGLGEANTICKMKELWVYWGRNFPEKEKAKKDLFKAKRMAEYLAATAVIFSFDKGY